MQDKSVPSLVEAGRDLSHVVRSGRSGERLRAVRDGTDLSLSERLRHALSVVPPDDSIQKSAKQIGRYLQGADIPLSFLTELQVASGIPADWIISGRAWTETQVLQWQEGRQVEAGAELDAGQFALLPRYEVRASAGPGLVAVHERVAEELAFRRDWLSRLGVNPENCGVVGAEGDSMFPTIPDRAVMVVDFSIREVRNGMIYVMVRNGEVIVKRVQTKGGSIVLISDNERYERETISRDDLTELNVAGRVVWVGHAI